MKESESLTSMCHQCGDVPGTQPLCETCQRTNPELKKQAEKIYEDSYLRKNEIRPTKHTDNVAGKPGQKFKKKKPLHGPGSDEWNELKEKFNLPPYKNPPR